MKNSWTREAVGQRLYQRCQELAAISQDQPAVTRVYLSKEHKLANRQAGEWMQAAGMVVWQDAVGNICGRYEGLHENAPALLLGSHLDTVRNAGRYDGILGVVTAIELVGYFHEQGLRFPFAIEVVGFADEEGTRFGSTLLGSRGLAQGWPSKWLATTDADGISIEQALRQFGLDPEHIERAQRNRDDFIGYLEVHIEQGPILEANELAVGVVTAINGAKRLHFSLQGMAGHAGTVPMSLRQDALVAASEMILAIERIATEQNVVATVGQIECHPGAINVIPGDVLFSVDIRASDDEVRDHSLDLIIHQTSQIATRRQIQLKTDCFYESAATPCDEQLQQFLRLASEKIQGQVVSLPSGAGHDAMAIADLCPVGMLFVRCDRGISHHPDEAVQSSDLGVAFEVLVETIIQLRSQYV
ncbi:allantoate amidohydrolase [Celerinatantimonas sp. YJH-8]|uniref:allantoate amidohydrolase n=1 Tax=Celerinatantimonas sp. YJH-8 TaxID=3228714 RepID=UPI0038C653DE